MIEIGTVVASYEIKEISKGYCYAERVKKLQCSDYVVWNMDSDGNGVNTGRYYKHRDEAIQRFTELTTTNM